MKTKSVKKKLEALGVFGFGALEPVILAALVTEDPLLLIGASGTGKTFLLNSLSEALGLEHRHYNASLISFDDLIGFPYPDPEKQAVKYLETPATVWGAESVLVDEISRCKPEHQNRLFSLIHERRIQGLPLPKLRFRWAAMNPCTSDQAGVEDYAGSEPLDPALADRFALFVTATDWKGLTDDEKRLVANPGGEGAVSEDGGALREQIARWREQFLRDVANCPPQILDYATAATTALNMARIRISPRRARLLSRSLLAARIVYGKMRDELFLQVLSCSLPHATWGAQPGRELVQAAHRTAWDNAMLVGDRKWIHSFQLEDSLVTKIHLLRSDCPGPDAGTQAVEQLLSCESPARAGAFAFVAYPAAIKGKLIVGAEAINDLGKVASPILTVDGEITWSERASESGATHPEIPRYAAVVEGLSGARKARAKQFFNWCLVAKIKPEDPAALEQEIHECMKAVSSAR